MTASNFAACLPVILAHEGGLSMIRSDPGNWTGGKVGAGALKGTNFGIAASSHPHLDIKALTKDSVAPIYEHEYWGPAACDGLPDGLDLSHFDGTVNSGLGNSSKWLAKATGSAVVDRIHAYATARLSFLHALRTWASFGKGWNTRVADVEARSVRMALGSAQAATDLIKRKADTLSKTAGTAGKASTASTLVTAGAATAAVTTGHPVLDAAIGTLTLIAAAYAGYVSWRDGARAAALTHVAAS